MKVGIQTKKVACKVWLHNKAVFSLHLRYAEALESIDLLVKKSGMQSFENFGLKLDPVTGKSTKCSGIPFDIFTEKKHWTHRQGCAQGGFWVKTSLEFDMLQKLYYLHKGDELFSHIFWLLICRLNANTME